MKKLWFAIFTVLVMGIEFGISYLIFFLFNYQLLGAMFLVGLVCSLVTIFFSSSGGIVSNYTESNFATSILGLKNGYKFKRTLGSVSVNCFNLGSVLFFVLGFVIAFAI
ncbi:hypothetical protein [Robertmurraya kyonggiensis]|uniref:Uncharacterized protein n=1 Tax=Robertmurraya kyonggiensis TaxID=1037680 RepID=A0A4U1DBB0_9BACI|nr:hypothetical protein [Robertmurraya kyonggiensis]TKC19333.1 hypothetical protein FA727_07280 [Robertmurraya kyonggiensis]